jgi:integrase
LELRARGIRELPTLEPDGVRLQAVAEKHEQRELQRLTIEGRSAATFKKLHYKMAPWTGRVEVLDGLGRPFHTRTVAGITAGDVSDWMLEDAARMWTTTRDRLMGLRAVLRAAEDRGVPVDHRIYRLRMPAHETREGIALSYPELEYVASFAFENDYRGWLFAGTVGLRIGELLTAVDDWFDADAMTLTVPTGCCKERREKVIQLFPEERDLLLEQQAQRVLQLRGPRLLFPRPRGTGYGSESGWHQNVFAPAIRRAIDHHTREYGCEPRWAWWMRDADGNILRRKDGTQLAKSGNTVLKRGQRRYDGLEPHDLRRTAISLMREAGMAEEHVAARVGHVDDSQQRTYRKVRPDEQRRVIRTIGTGLGAHLTAAHAADAEAPGG